MAKVSTWTLYKLHKLLIFCGSLLLNTSDFLKAFTAFCTETSQLSISILIISFFQVFDPYTEILQLSAFLSTSHMKVGLLVTLWCISA